MFRASLAALLAATPIAFVAGPSLPATAADPGLPTISVSAANVVLGKPVLIHGQGPGLRRLVLQLRTKENGWQKVATTLTGVGGSYTFVGPGWEGTHRLRVWSRARSSPPTS